MANFSNMSFEELRNEYWGLLSKSNQKISAMEHTKHENPTYAYTKVKSNLEKLGQERFPKLSEFRTSDRNKLLTYISLADKYVNSATFSFKGMEETVNKSFMTLADKYGFLTDDKDTKKAVADFWKTGVMDKIRELYNSIPSDEIVTLVSGTSNGKADKIKKVTECMKDWVNSQGEYGNTKDDLEDYITFRMGESK